ncbi:MAG: MscL family protein [Deltaproteobacteria bacterium]|nr:MscL family protein [Deltaproteobacteria bacterium]
MIDIAIGMLIGSGVTPIATSLINDMIMPPVGYVLGNADLSNLFFTLKAGFPTGPYSSLLHAKEAGAVTINYGKFLNTVLSFLVVAWVAFFIVKASNKIKRLTEHAHHSTTDSR